VALRLAGLPARRRGIAEHIDQRFLAALAEMALFERQSSAPHLGLLRTILEQIAAGELP
jgi:hypothetical protein